MRKIIFYIFFTIFSFASDIVFNPYGDLNTTADDTNFDSYLNYVTDSLIRKQEVRDRLQELQKPKDTIVLDNMVGTATKTIYDNLGVASTSEINSFNIFDKTALTNWQSKFSGEGIWEAYGPFPYIPYDTSYSVYSDGRTYDYTRLLKTIAQTNYQLMGDTVNMHSMQQIQLAVDENSLLLQKSQAEMQVTSLNEIFKQTNALNEIKAQIQTSNVLSASGNSKLDSIATLTDYVAINTNAGAYNSAVTNLKLDETNALLTGISDTLNLGGDFTGFDTSGVNVSSDSILASTDSFFDNFGDKFTGIVDDATSIKTDFDNIKSIVSGNDIAPFSMVSSSGACDISFNFFGSSITPLSSLPSILSRYSAVFSLLTYISIMFLNFRFLFLFFAVGRK